MKALISALLSFLLPGLGQFHNGHSLKGILFYFLYLILFFILYFLNLFQTFNGFITMLILALGIYLYIIIDAAYYAKKGDAKEIAFLKKWYVYVILLIIHFFISSQYQDYVNTNFITAHKVKTGSMEPTLKMGDLFLADYHYFKNFTVTPNDVVVIRFPKDPNKKFIERCIAIAGQEIEIRNSIVYVNGELYPDIQHIQKDDISDSGYPDNQDNYGPVRVPEEHCFVLGDNRKNSYDSRYWGFVPYEDVIAKPLYIYWADDLDRIGMIID